MNEHRSGKTAAHAAAFLVTIAASSLPSGVARADEQKDIEVQGTLASTQVVGDACHSPIGLCTSGTMTGGLAGTFTYTAKSLLVLPDGVTGIFDGTLVLTTRNGTITEHDHTTANLVTGALVDVITILCGTERWEGASGTIYLQGSFNFASGVGASTYAGTVTVPED
jgi:hypothetical protein